MFHENEDKVMVAPGVCFGGSSCRHTFAPSVSVKKPGSHVRHLCWLHVQLLVILLAGQASCNETAAPSPSSATTNAQTSVHYTVYVSVNGTKNESEIKAWFIQVFQNNLDSCGSQTSAETSAPPTSPQTETTLVTTATTLQNYNTTAVEASTPFKNNNATTAVTSTMSESLNTTTVTSTTSESLNTTTVTSTTSESLNITTATSTTSESLNITTATSTTSESLNTTTGATSTTSESLNITTATSTTSESLNTTTATSTTSENLNITTAATSTTSESLNTTTGATSTTSESLNTTTAATSTTAESLNTTTATSTTSESLGTTTVTSTTSESLSTTTAATSTAAESLSTSTVTSTTAESLSTTTAATSTTAESLSTTTAATSTTAESLSTSTVTSTTAESLSTSTVTSTTAESLSTTTAATSTTAESLGTTTVTSTTAEHLSTTTAATESSTTSSPGGGMPKPSNSPNSNSNKRVAREILDPVAETSGVAGDKTTGLFQNLEVSCTANANGEEIICLLTLELKQSVSPCCILRKLCDASQTSSNITVVGKRADKINQLQDNCSSNQQEQSSCIYTGQGTALCNNSETAYQVPQLSSTNCSADKQNNCNCSSSCAGPDAFYTFQISMKDPEIDISSVESLLSKLKHPPNCPPDVPCPLTVVASEFKDLRLTCNNTGAIPQSCRVILDFAHEVPICNVSMALMTVLQPETKISYDGLVTRAAICGNSVSSSMFSNQQFTWVEVAKKPAIFCKTLEESNLKCQNGENVVVLLDEQCTQNLFTTPGPNVTTIQPSTNLTQNATTTAVNVTVTVTLNATSTNESISVTPSESPTTTESADSQANALLELTSNVAELNASQVAQLVSQLENLLSGPTVSLALGNTSVHIVSNLLGASPETLSGSSNRIIGIVDTVALKLVLEQQPETLLSPSVALSVKPADGSNFQETFFSISDPTNVQVRGDPRHRRSAKRDSSIPQGSIRLPPSLTQDLTTDEQHMASRVQFNFYQKSTVFQDKSLGKRKLNSGILGASVANLSITGLQEDVVIHLKNIEPVPANFVASCVFWDFTLNNGSGGWSSSGCYVQNSTNNEIICSCNHLTSFAILLDLAREPLTSRLQDTILTFITYIGCGISSIFLSITLLTYLAFGKLRKDIPSKILIQLCLALLLLNMVFLVDAWLALYPKAVGLCISTAWFLHYFLLVAFTWMGLEAVHMYLALVKVFNSYISRYMLKFSLVGWGVPMIVVIIVIAIDKNNYGLVSYGKFPDGTTDDFCWLKNDIAFYVAVVAYFCVIFLFNFVMFIVVLVQLQRLKRQNPHNALHRTTLQDARSVAGITMLLGLTWGFAFFAWGPVNLAFMYLFAIFNSFQGLFIFVFHCALKENVRRQWRTYLCCGRMRLAENSEWSRTATQKTVKKSSVTKLTSLHSSKSSKSNNSSSSSSFLVSDSSEQINGIGNPIEDRVITANEDPSMDVILNEINSQYRNQQAP